MTLRSCSALVRHLTTGAVVTALLAIGAAPAMAASPDTKHPPSFSHKAVAKIVASSATPATPATAPKTTPKQATSSGSFLKTRTGLLVIAVMAVGTGYAVYSAKEDRIRGINR
jgi:hypothetical protein